MSIGSVVAPANARESSSRAAPMATTSPTTAPPTASRTLSISASTMICVRDAPRARRTAIWPRRATARARQQVGDVRARDEQHHRAHHQQNPQAAPVLLLHHADTCTCRHHGDDLLRHPALDFRHEVRGVSGIVPHPLMEQHGEPRLHAVDRRVRTQPSDHPQPCRRALAQQRRIGAGDERFVLQRQPEVWRVGAQGLAEEPRWCDPGDRERVAFDHQRGAHDRGVAAVETLPGVVGHYCDGCCGGAVVAGSEDTTRERAHAQRREVAARGIHRPERPRRLGHALTPDAHAAHECLKGGDVLELRGLRLDALEQRKRKEPPTPLGPSLYATVAAVADPVEARRIGHRERLHHQGVHERKDRRRAADAQRQRQHSRGREDSRRAERAEGVRHVADQSAHARLDGGMCGLVDGDAGVARRNLGAYCMKKTSQRRSLLAARPCCLQNSGRESSGISRAGTGRAAHRELIT